jgi:hypothetical protein
MSAKSFVKEANKEICATYFNDFKIIQIPDKGAIKAHTVVTCACGDNLKWNGPCQGYTNMMAHIYKKHPNFSEEWEIFKEMRDNGAHQATLQQYLICPKAQQYYDYLSLFVEHNLPHSLLDSESFKKILKLKSLSRTTFGKVLRNVASRVEVKIQEMLPECFGIMLDGWSYGSEHFIALFAIFGKDQVLLNMATLPEETNLTAESHKQYIEETLESDGKTI